MERLVFDIEGNGLVRDINRLWCICICDLSKRNYIEKYTPDLIEQGLDRLSKSQIIIGHNICGFDIPAIQRLYPGWTYNQLRDTYCMSKLFNPERSGGHSLESYGESYGIPKPEHEDWTQYSPEMLYRCSQDVKINTALYSDLVRKYCTDWDWIESLRLEQEDTLYQVEQELSGVDFNSVRAAELVIAIDNEIKQLDDELLTRIPKRVYQVGTTITNPFKKDGTLIKRVKDWV